jgi:hypothetical protein
MMDYLAGLNFLEKIYLVCALFGGGFFILRTILMLAGIGDAHSDMDMDSADVDSVDLDHDGQHFEDIDHGDHGDHGEGDAGLKLLTIQGITAFVMMFGLTGFAFSRSSFFGSIATIVISGVVGLLGMWLIAKGFALMRSLQSSGTMQIYDAIGEEGNVYLTIPAEGIGKIQITISGRLMVMDAISQDKIELKTGERVCVSEITSGGMLSVRGL